MSWIAAHQVFNRRARTYRVDLNLLGRENITHFPSFAETQFLKMVAVGAIPKGAVLRAAEIPVHRHELRLNVTHGSFVPVAQNEMSPDFLIYLKRSTNEWKVSEDGVMEA